MDFYATDAEMDSAHARIGGFIVRCSLLDYRVSQFVSRWFCAHDKQKFLSYTLNAMPFSEKRQVIEERLVNWHQDPEALRIAAADIAAVLERRALVANGVLSRNSSGALCIKSFSAAKIISEPNAIDIFAIADLEGWSEKASEITERLITLGNGLRDSAA